VVAPGLRVLLVVLLAFMLAAVLPAPASSEPPEDQDQAPAMVTFSFGGGTITMNPDLVTGPRFLTKVPPPVFTRTEDARANPDLQPGDGGDYGPIVTERKVTDYSYMDEPWTGGMRINSVHGTPTEYICICDAVFVNMNTNGMDPTRPVRATGSRYLWFDNVTLYGGSIHLVASQFITVSNSLFVDAGAVFGQAAGNVLVHGITVVNQRSPTNLVNSPPILGGAFQCIPHPVQCSYSDAGGFDIWDWLIEWSYFHGPGFAGTPNGRNMIIRHNTFFDAMPVWAFGDNEISWNLIRGNSDSGPYGFYPASTSFHNNSIVFPFKADHRSGFIANGGLSLENCGKCNLLRNDWIGYGVQNPLFSQCCPALRAVHGTSHIVANDNFWGTLHDPRVPPGVWIHQGSDVTLLLDRWQIQPNHDITPIVFTLDLRDVPWWIDQLTGTPLDQHL
jgi:hypothetical protein